MRNLNSVDFIRTGYGQWNAVTIYYGKEIKAHFTDAPTVDLIVSRERGYKTAINNVRQFIIRKNK